jgi:hypothetical protein
MWVLLDGVKACMLYEKPKARRDCHSVSVLHDVYLMHVNTQSPIKHCATVPCVQCDPLVCKSRTGRPLLLGRHPFPSNPLPALLR